MSRLSDRRLATMRAYSRRLRSLRRDHGWCVNHSGRPATHGVRCEECDVVHRRTSSRKPIETNQPLNH